MRGLNVDELIDRFGSCSGGDIMTVEERALVRDSVVAKGPVVRALNTREELPLGADDKQQRSLIIDR